MGAKKNETLAGTSLTRVRRAPDPVEGFMTSDGQYFDTLAESESEQDELDIKSNVETLVDDMYFREIGKDAIVEYVIEHRLAFLDALGTEAKS
jgi:hypothetical protein